MNIHHSPAFHRLRHDLAHIGRPRIISLNYSQFSSRYPDFCNGLVHPVFDPEQLGGALMDINVYNLHAVISLFGFPEDFHYTANIQRGVDTSGILTLRYPGFSAVCIGAKDSGPGGTSALEGEDGTILLEEPVNQLTGYRILPRNGEPETVRVPGSGDRIYDEFLSLLDLYKRKDRSRLTELKKISLEAARILEEARNSIYL